MQVASFIVWLGEMILTYVGNYLFYAWHRRYSRGMNKTHKPAVLLLAHHESQGRTSQTPRLSYNEAAEKLDQETLVRLVRVEQ